MQCPTLLCHSAVPAFAGASPFMLGERGFKKLQNRKTKVASYNFDLNLILDYWGCFGKRQASCIQPYIPSHAPKLHFDIFAQPVLASGAQQVPCLGLSPAVRPMQVLPPHWHDLKLVRHPRGTGDCLSRRLGSHVGTPPQAAPIHVGGIEQAGSGAICREGAVPVGVCKHYQGVHYSLIIILYSALAKHKRRCSALHGLS